MMICQGEPTLPSEGRKVDEETRENATLVLYKVP